MNVFSDEDLIAITIVLIAAAGYAPLTERMRDAQNSAKSTPNC